MSIHIMHVGSGWQPLIKGNMKPDHNGVYTYDRGHVHCVWNGKNRVMALETHRDKYNPALKQLKHYRLCEGARKAESWSVFNYYPSRRLTLPYLMLNEPFMFWLMFQIMICGDPDVKPEFRAKAGEAMEVYQKACRIRVPNKQLVQHEYKGTARYNGFKLVEPERAGRLQENVSQLILDDVIDFSVITPIPGKKQRDAQRWLESFYTAFGGDKRDRWTEDRCQCFFNDADNFEVSDYPYVKDERGLLYGKKFR
jgi:hypothetical protein